MTQHGYPGYPGHKKLHDEFVKQVNDLQKDFDEGKTLPVKTSQFLRDWLTNHILKVDQQYSAFLNANGVR
ncbi:hemerythrin HHE cation binding region [Candidatus Moduliflexus flocculans]|uniref:Hemerythrin HHE cation binding region n=1 Tax=Candidatus Moduliflexus flocculans TaxID=1499966 RepID=A0A0S6VTF6_9BACT|nr:hemerythrin HHE cation binding region [Candidatus Moduliflexus flocculans]